MSESYERVEVGSRAAWRKWLASNHDSSPGIWAVTYKKSSGGPYVSYDEIVDEAVAHGWIDSLGKRVDEERTRLLITPRKPKSGWSRVNKERVRRIEADGTMSAAGRAAIAAAKESGAWSRLDEIENLTEPKDLKEALASVPKARAHWDGFPRSTKRAILEWIANAKRDETRARRVEETARLAGENVRANQPRQPGSRT